MAIPISGEPCWLESGARDVCLRKKASLQQQQQMRRVLKHHVRLHHCSRAWHAPMWQANCLLHVLLVWIFHNAERSLVQQCVIAPTKKPPSPLRDPSHPTRCIFAASLPCLCAAHVLCAHARRRQPFKQMKPAQHPVSVFFWLVRLYLENVLRCRIHFLSKQHYATNHTRPPACAHLLVCTAQAAPPPHTHTLLLFQSCDSSLTCTHCVVVFRPPEFCNPNAKH